MNAIDIFLEHLKKNISLNENDELIIRYYFKEKQLKKKEILLFAGDESCHMQFIAKGSLRAYYMDEEAKECKKRLK